MKVRYACRNERCLWREDNNTSISFCMRPSCPSGMRVKVLSYDRGERESVKTPGRPRLYTTELLERIKSMRNLGMSAREIARVTGRTEHQISNAIQRYRLNKDDEMA